MNITIFVLFLCIYTILSKINNFHINLNYTTSYILPSYIILNNIKLYENYYLIKILKFNTISIFNRALKLV